MDFQVVGDTVILFMLGACGWLVFKAIRFPTPAFMGTVMVIGALRAARVELPPAPEYLSVLVQLIIGLYVGAKINRETVRQLKHLPLPAAIIVTWSIAMVFVLGRILTGVSGLDIYTAMLSSSMGGLAEMSILALSTNARIEIIIIVQLCRVVLTLVAFPVLLLLWVPREAKVSDVKGEGNTVSLNHQLLYYLRPANAVGSLKISLAQAGGREVCRVLFSLAVAAAGGFFFSAVGVPAGLMVGAMLSVAVASSLGFRIIAPASSVISFLLVGVGITISDSITPDTLTTLLSGNLYLIVAVSTVAIFLSSLVVAYAMCRVTGWDYATSFLAAAPAGFTVMTVLADKYDKDPFKVSILHLCRLISLKMFLPFFFMLSDKL